MIEIKVTGFGEGAQGEIKGRKNAVEQMFAVLTALDRMDDEVLVDAFELFLKFKMKEKKDNDESEG